MKKKLLTKLNTFFSKYELLKMKRKEVLMKSSERRIDYVYFLTKGYVRQCFIDEGEEVILNVFRPYSFFPMIFIMNEMPNTYNYRAITDIEVYRAPRKEVMKFVSENSDILFDLASRLGLGLNRMLALVTFLRLTEAKSRVFELLWLLATRFGAKSGKYYAIDFPLTHRDIASFTGLRRETVSREMSALERAKRLKIVKRRIWITKKERRSKLAKKP